MKKQSRPPRSDRTLRVRRWVFGKLYQGLRTGPGQGVLTALLAADHPRLALAQGDLLCSRAWRVLAFTAHPDDLEFFAGGTLRRLVLAGSDVRAVCLTDGEKHGNDPALGARRRGEQQQAAHLQGFRSVEFCGLPDFGLPEDPRLEQVIAEAWNRHQPELVLAFDPKELVPNMANRDHKALGRAVMDYARLQVGKTTVCFYGTHHPNLLVDLTDVIADKIQAVHCHETQLVYLSEAGYDEAVYLMARASARGSGCTYAEGLYRLM